MILTTDFPITPIEEKATITYRAPTTSIERPASPFTPRYKKASWPLVPAYKISPSAIILSKPTYSHSELSEAIERSKVILTYTDNWDEEGSPGYAEETWQRAIDFISRQSLIAWERLGEKLPPPKILPGPNGSVDVLWKSKEAELLFNFPSDLSKPATFYGEKPGLSIKGSIDPSTSTLGPMLWLTSTP